ncbi:pirin family protein [Synechococcus sp. RSCCF101]|uniref:pirin family protein n=1 Tax=Synechococcus sp. RSCCF101 TaxID=2511069 RepID=UPI00124799F1|nr:pirin family protein [Synechococcus sp. RSCCF101]QEY32748.1 pirin family protein [Synechococcus sp. RSCCF101]
MPSPLPPPAGPIRLRRAAERFHSRLDWLDSWHSFSFAGHHDPDWSGCGPLRVINDDTIAAGKGFGMHPHRDMEIITVMVEGELHHRDSMGTHEVLRAGEVQRMTTGTGMVHSEMNEGSEPCRLLQIWVEPEANQLPPGYQQRHFRIGGDWSLLVDGADAEHDTEPGADREVQGASQDADASHPLHVHQGIRLWRARPQAGQQLHLPLASGAPAWLQLIDGDGALETGGSDDSGPLDLYRGDGLAFRPAKDCGAGITAGTKGADLLLFELG